MFHKEKPDYHRCQYGFYTIDELVPEDHFLRQLEVEFDLDRRKHEKKSLKPTKGSEAREKKISRTDPESGWFHKGEHKKVFAYSAQVACDKRGWALAYTVEAGNVHDSQAFPTLFAKIEPFHLSSPIPAPRE